MTITRHFHTFDLPGKLPDFILLMRHILEQRVF
jgi:hypothetical protein